MATMSEDLVHTDNNETENHTEEASPEPDEKPKQKMSARYNLFRYKSKDISDMTYNGEFRFRFRVKLNMFIDNSDVQIFIFT